MAKPLPLSFSARVAVTQEAAPGRFRVTASAGEIQIRGFLSTGTRGWQLRGDAARRRSVISLYVTAIEAEHPRVPDIELYEYEAKISLKAGGRYGIRISHAFLLRPEG